MLQSSNNRTRNDQNVCNVCLNRTMPDTEQKEKVASRRMKNYKASSMAVMLQFFVHDYKTCYWSLGSI